MLPDMRRMRGALRLFPAGAWTRLGEELERERGRFALWAPVLLGAGVVTYFALLWEPPHWLGGAVAAPLLIVAWFGRRRVWPWLSVIPLSVIALGFGAAQVATMRALPVEPDVLPRTASWLTARVVGVELLPGGRRLTLDQVRYENGPALVREVRVRLRQTDPVELGAGDRVRVRALIRPVGPPLYPGGWDRQRDAFYAGLAGYGYALGHAERLVQALPSAPVRAMQRLREAMADRIVHVLPGAEGQVLVGILLGMRSGIAWGDLAAFRDSGLAHLLAVSGLHLAIVMGAVMTIARFAFALSEYASLHWPTRQLAALVALVFGGLYTVLTGMQVPVVRCFLMACIVAVALLAGRRPVSLRGLAIAATLIILLDPDQVMGASMQMSFSAVLVLIAGYEALRPVLWRLQGEGWVRRIGLQVLGLMLTSALAGTASTPFGAYHFGRVQIYYVVSNIVAVPLTTILVMPAGMLSLPLMLFDLEWVALIPAGWGVNATLAVAHTVSSWPAAAVDVPHMPGWGLAAIALGIAWLGLWRSRLRLFGVAGLALGICSPMSVRLPDMLVSGDGREIAVRTEAGVFMQQARWSSDFVRDNWLRYLGVASAKPIPETGEAAEGAVRCDGNTCVLRPRPDGAAALLVRYPDPVQQCAGIAVIVSARPARGLCPRPWPELVDRFTVWRDGPAAIWLDPRGARVLTDRAYRGARPWVPPVPNPRSTAPPDLPLAPAEGG